MILDVSEVSAIKRKATSAFQPEAFLAKVSKGRTVADYKKNPRVFSRGDPADAILYIQKGKVKVTVVSKQGKEAFVGILGADNRFAPRC